MSTQGNVRGSEHLNCVKRDSLDHLSQKDPYTVKFFDESGVSLPDSAGGGASIDSTSD